MFDIDIRHTNHIHQPKIILFLTILISVINYVVRNKLQLSTYGYRVCNLKCYSHFLLIVENSVFYEIYAYEDLTTMDSLKQKFCPTRPKSLLRGTRYINYWNKIEFCITSGFQSSTFSTRNIIFHNTCEEIKLIVVNIVNLLFKSFIPYIS